MLAHGDEVARTQRGNNRTYCQDNELSWQPWDLTPEQQVMLDWTRRMISFRKNHPGLRRRDFFRGRAIRGAGARDITWLRADGRDMRDADWGRHDVHCLGMYLFGVAPDLYDDAGKAVIDDSLLLLFNNAGRVRAIPPPASAR